MDGNRLARLLHDSFESDNHRKASKQASKQRTAKGTETETTENGTQTGGGESAPEEEGPVLGRDEGGVHQHGQRGAAERVGERLPRGAEVLFCFGVGVLMGLGWWGVGIGDEPPNQSVNQPINLPHKPPNQQPNPIPNQTPLTS